jgi:hypothetical protein
MKDGDRIDSRVDNTGDVSLCFNVKPQANRSQEQANPRDRHAERGDLRHRLQQLRWDRGTPLGSGLGRPGGLLPQSSRPEVILSLACSFFGIFTEIFRLGRFGTIIGQVTFPLSPAIPGFDHVALRQFQHRPAKRLIPFTGR